MDPLENEPVSIGAHCKPLAIDYHQNYNEKFASPFDSENRMKREKKRISIKYTNWRMVIVNGTCRIHFLF